MDNEPNAPAATNPAPVAPRERKVNRDKGRKRTGKVHKKRARILMHPKIKAFKGWKTEPEPWNYKTACKYVDWCHIDKVFPWCRHKEHVKQNKVNLAYCLDTAFQRRCCEVWHALYLEEATYRNDNFCLFLVRMVYAEMVLKKEVDWSTLPETHHASPPAGPKIPTPDVPVDLTKMLSKPKRKKSLIPDEKVKWSSNSSSDEHTHEYDGYDFDSDNEDVDMQDGQTAANPISLPNSDEDLLKAPLPDDVDQFYRDMGIYDETDSGGDSEEDLELLRAQIESANLALQGKKKEVETLKEHQRNPTSVDVLRQQSKAIKNAIDENDRAYAVRNKARAFYMKKLERGKLQALDDWVLWDSKLDTLSRRRFEAESERLRLNLEITQREKEFYDAAVQHAPHLEELASSSEYGEGREELSVLRTLVKFHEMKLPVLISEFKSLQAETQYYADWCKWFRFIIGFSEAPEGGVGPEPILMNYLNES